MCIADKMVRVVMNVLILVEVVMLKTLFCQLHGVQSTPPHGLGVIIMVRPVRSKLLRQEEVSIKAATVSTATGTFNNIHQHFCRGSCPTTTTTSTATAASGSMGQSHPPRCRSRRRPSILTSLNSVTRRRKSRTLCNPDAWSRSPEQRSPWLALS